MASSSSSSSPIIPQAKYDVFLSFRGEDTRHNFTSHLYDALCQKKILTFIDDNLKRGDEISQALLKTIEGSKISIIIFSKDYASSRWCLNELEKIIECKEKNGQVVVPVFYHITPSDVRKQSGSYKNAFVEHEKHFKKMPEKVQRWRTALTEASNLSGWDSMVIKRESTLVEKVVEDILKKLNDLSTTSSDCKGLVGINSRIEKIKSLLCIGLSDFRVIGIWGMGGIGKTTLAGAVYDQVSIEFEGHCFCINVRAESEKNGLIPIREQVLSQVLGENIKISTPNIPQYTQERIQRKKVFIVLDDVTLEQLDLLAGGLDQFGPGSRIVITTRDKQVLNSFGANNIYEVEGFNYDEAIQLFCSYAFKQNHPFEDFVELTNRMVDYAKGNPLALKVLGSALRGSEKKEWESAIYNIKMICDPKIHDVLKISFKKLNRDEKNVFLDIACFFNGDDSDQVTKILDGCYSSTHYILKALIKKSLVTISDDKLQMHDLLQEMGREIVHQESEKKPSERSRLWFHEDVYRVFRDTKGTDAVEGIFLDMSRIREVHLSSATFLNMINLRLLKFYKPWYFRNSKDVLKVHLCEDLNYPSNELRYFHWDEYPLETLPSEFSLENLVDLQLPYSNIKQLWKGTKEALKLKSINLYFSKHLTDFPNLSDAVKLESINLEGCKSLLDVSSCIQYCTNLRILNLSGCECLRSFPSDIHFKSPVTLNLSSCINLTKFPQISGNVKELNLTRTAIEEVPLSIANLAGLVELNLSFCNRLKSLSTSICKLKSLQRLNLIGCLELKSFPEILEKMESLKLLNLRRTAIKELPPSIEHLNGLEELTLEECKNLEMIPSSICNLTSLRDITLNDCSKLDKLPEDLGNLIYLENLCANRSPVSQLPCCMAFWKKVRYLHLASCNLAEIPEDLCCLCSLEKLDLSDNNFERLPTNIKQLSMLRCLYLRNCKMLQSIPELPQRLECLDARNCKRLQSVPEPPSCPEELDESELEIVSKCYCPFSTCTMNFLFMNCLKLNQKAYDNILADSEERIYHMATAALRLCYEKVFDNIPKISFCLPASKIPDWFSHQSLGSSITIELPPWHWFNRRLIGFALFAVIEFEKDFNEHRIEVKCNYSFQDYRDRFGWDCFVKLTNESIESDHIVLGYIPCMVTGDLTVSFEFKLLKISHFASVLRLPSGRTLEGCKIKCCGIHPLYAHPSMTQPVEGLATTNEDLVETTLADCSNINGSGNGRCNEEEGEPHANTDCSLRESGLLLFSCWNFIVSLFRQT